MYLPCWTDGLSFREQYDAYWIANEYEKAVKNGDGTSFYSLLPLRVDFDPYGRDGLYDLHSVGTFCDGFELCRTSEIKNSGEEFALQVWKAASEIIRTEYPKIEDVTYDDQLFCGVYPIHFSYPTEEIKNRQIEIIKELINNGFTIDEYLTVSYEQEEGRKTWNYKGIVGVSYQECREVFYNTPHGETMPLELNKQISYSYEECEQYYRLHDEKILMLGNQVRIYSQVQKKNAPLFDTIKENSIDRIKECVKNDYSLNAIGTNGNSAFASVLFSLFHDEEKEEWDDIGTEEKELLDYLFEHGANLAIYGVNSDACPLVEAVVCHRNKTAKWLLEKGVSPNIFPFIDDLCDEDVTLADWLEGSWHDEITPDDVTEMIQILKKYASGKQD